MSFYTHNERVYVHSVESYLKRFEEGYFDIDFSGDLDELVKALREKAETGLAYRYAYACRLIDVDQEATAFQIMQGLVDDGFDRANIGLSYCYTLGKGTEVDYAKALACLKAIEDKDYAPANQNLALAYYYGRGVAVDYGKALEYAEKAADQGMAKSGLTAVKILERKSTVDLEPVDSADVFRLSLKAARNGNLDAMDAVAAYYESGIGCQEDPIAAAAWRRQKTSIEFDFGGEFDGVFEKLNVEDGDQD